MSHHHSLAHKEFSSKKKSKDTDSPVPKARPSKRKRRGPKNNSENSHNLHTVKIVHYRIQTIIIMWGLFSIFAISHHSLTIREARKNIWGKAKDEYPLIQLSLSIKHISTLTIHSKIQRKTIIYPSISEDLSIHKSIYKSISPCLPIHPSTVSIHHSIIG